MKTTSSRNISIMEIPCKNHVFLNFATKVLATVFGFLQVRLARGFDICLKYQQRHESFLLYKIILSVLHVVNPGQTMIFKQN